MEVVVVWVLISMVNLIVALLLWLSRGGRASGHSSSGSNKESGGGLAMVVVVVETEMVTRIILPVLEAVTLGASGCPQALFSSWQSY
jgi:preprotein translocase subunit SecG